MAIRTVDPTKNYDRDSFVSAMEDFNDLERILYSVEKTNNGLWDPDTRAKLGDLFQDNPSFYAGLGADQVREDARMAIRTPGKNLNEYVERNWNTLIGRADFKAEDLFKILGSLPLAETGNKDLDRISEAIEESRNISEIKKAEGQGDYKTLQAYVAGKIAKSKDKDRKESYAYSSLDPEYNRRCFFSYEIAAARELEGAVKDEKGNIDRNKLLSLFKASYEKIKSEKGKDSGEAYRLLVAKSAYEKVK